MDTSPPTDPYQHAYEMCVFQKDALVADNARLRTMLKIARRHIPPGNLQPTADGLRYVLDMIDAELGHARFNAAPPAAPTEPS